MANTKANKEQNKVSEEKVNGKKRLTVSGPRERAQAAFGAEIDKAANNVTSMKEATKAGFAAALAELKI